MPCSLSRNTHAAYPKRTVSFFGRPPVRALFRGVVAIPAANLSRRHFEEKRTVHETRRFKQPKESRQSAFHGKHAAKHGHSSRVPLFCKLRPCTVVQYKNVASPLRGWWRGCGVLGLEMASKLRSDCHPICAPNIIRFEPLVPP